MGGQGGGGEGGVLVGEGGEEERVGEGFLEGGGSVGGVGLLVSGCLCVVFWLGWFGERGGGETNGLSRRTSGSQFSDGVGGGGLDCWGVAGGFVSEGGCGGGGGRGGPFVVGV